MYRNRGLWEDVCKPGDVKRGSKSVLHLALLSSSFKPALWLVAASGGCISVRTPSLVWSTISGPSRVSLLQVRFILSCPIVPRYLLSHSSELVAFVTKTDLFLLHALKSFRIRAIHYTVSLSFAFSPLLESFGVSQVWPGYILPLKLFPKLLDKGW